jgi:anthranilate phosphoribosyltransferase
MSIAPYLKDIGRGAAGARDLGMAAAEALMGEVLDGRASAAECGAFVMAMRMKGETLDELAGFLNAVQARCLVVPSERPVVLLPSYNGSRRLPNLTPLLAMSLAREGLNVLVHGPLTEPQRVASAAILADLGLAPAQQAQDIERAWARREPAFVPTALLCPPLQQLLELRALIGLRGPGHTVAKMLNPVQGAPALRVVNHTHPEFGALMAAWAQRHAVDAQLLRGTEGEPVADPRRQPRFEAFAAGVRLDDLSLAPTEGVLTQLPALPASMAADVTAAWIHEALAGHAGVPEPIKTQVTCLKALVTR